MGEGLPITADVGANKTPRCFPGLQTCSADLNNIPAITLIHLATEHHQLKVPTGTFIAPSGEINGPLGLREALEQAHATSLRGIPR